MNKLMKKISILLIITLSFTLFVGDVNAISFKCGKSSNNSTVYIQYDKYYDFQKVTSSKGDGTCYKQVTDTDEEAYCATRNLAFGQKSNRYLEDKSWQTNMKCWYYYDGPNGERIKGYGQCSRIMGFILNESSKKFNSSYGSPNKKYKVWIANQGVVWTYLRWHTTDTPYWANNNVDLLWKDSAEKIKDAIRKGWNAYYKYINGNPNSARTDENVNFTILDSNNPSLEVKEATFNFSPTGNSCGTSGYYVTKKMAIKNNNSKTIDVTVFKKDGSKVCSDNGCESGDLKVQIPAGGSYVFYLRSENDAAIAESNLGTLNVRAIFTEEVNGTQQVYDTEMYYPVDKNNNAISDGQKMLIMADTSDQSTYLIKHSKTISINLKQNKIIHYTCASDDNLGLLRSGYESSNSKNDPTVRVCAANIPDSELLNEDTYRQYTASFQGCKCTSVDLGNKNGSIAVIYTERVTFQYGIFETDNVYPGGGFGLDTSIRDTSTRYSAKLFWNYANTDVNGNPYYYNSNNNEGVIVEKNNDTNLGNKIRDYFKNKRDENAVSIPIDTLNSNDSSKEKPDYSLEVKYDGSGDIDRYYDHYKDIYTNFSSRGAFVILDDVIEMNKAFFSGNGNVSYTQDGKYTIDGGNKYYVPLVYDSNRFPFNVKATNLSLTGLFDFYYKADCDIGVGDYKYGAFYRTIDVEDPFIKTNNVASSVNWSEWWNGNTQNQKRVNNTFSYYPNNPTYKVVIDNSLINKYVNYNKSYTNWDTVNEDGSNTFVNTSNGFEFSGINSYCEIGRLSSSCDK